MVPFGGWSMPVEYAGAGILKEHAATRSAAALYDVSHMGVLSVRRWQAAHAPAACNIPSARNAQRDHASTARSRPSAGNL